ncbi:MAG: 2-oxoacid:acceptor oxidoreductase family protein [Candidatus Kariarchaeaceae archaeon]|jgi:pyruvate ferredoxin oxidoreductase gamma subunit
MSKEFEISILSRGGQGGVTLSKIIAYAATYDGYYTTAIPKYGAERRGAPITTSVRIYDRPVKRHAQISTPTDIMALDVSVVPRFFPTDPFDGKGTLTLNAADLPEEYSIYKPAKLGLCNVQEITIEEGLVKSGSAMIGIPTLGAFIRTTEILTMKSLHKAIDKMFGDSRYLQNNHDAVERTYNETEVITYEREIIS